MKSYTYPHFSYVANKIKNTTYILIRKKGYKCYKMKSYSRWKNVTLIGKVGKKTFLDCFLEFFQLFFVNMKNEEIKYGKKGRRHLSKL